MTDTAVLAEVPDDAESLQAQAAVLRNILLHGGTLGAAAGVSQQDCEALYQLDHGLYQQTRYTEAFRIFSLLVTYDHLEPRYLMALAASAQMLGRYADAIQHYGTAAVLMLDDPAPLLHSAECCIAIQQMEGAAEALRMAIGLIDQEPQHEALRPRAQALLAPLAAAGH